MIIEETDFFNVAFKAVSQIEVMEPKTMGSPLKGIHVALEGLTYLLATEIFHKSNTDGMVRLYPGDLHKIINRLKRYHADTRFVLRCVPEFADMIVIYEDLMEEYLFKYDEEDR